MRSFILCLFLAAHAMASSDALSKEETAQLLKKYQFKGRISGTFEQSKKIQELGITLKSSGTFQVTRENEQDVVHWDILKPEPLSICIDSKVVAIKDKDMKKPMVHLMSESKGKDPTSLSQLQSVFKYDIDQLRKDFVVKKIASEIKLEGPQETIWLKMANSGFISQVRMVDQQQDESVIIFKNIKHQKTVKESKACVE